MSRKDSIIHDLSEIRSRADQLQIPTPVFLGITGENGTIRIAERGAEDIVHRLNIPSNEDYFSYISAWFRKKAMHENHKHIAATLGGEGDLHALGSQLWLEEDIACWVSDETEASEEKSADLAFQTKERFSENNIAQVTVDDRNEVNVHGLVTKGAYEEVSTNEELQVLDELIQKCKDKKIVFVSATPQGGGVALMRHALIRFMRLWGADVHWHVLEERPDAFLITKTKFHNVLQAVADPEVELTDEEKELYNAWIQDNMEMLREPLLEADVVIIDDPQPAGLVPYIREENKNAKVIYRSHIQVVAELADTEDTPQKTTWDFVWSHIKDADLFVSHPMKKFVPETLPRDKTLFMPATTDPLDGLNKPLTDEQMEYYFKIFDKLLIERHQSPLDHDRPYIIQVARFDPSKGIPDVIESFKKVRKRLAEDGKVLPQLLIVGNGSIDDPDGVPIYNLIMEMLESEDYRDIAEDIKVARLPHIDQLLNTLLRGSKVALQLSHKEGFEVKVTEALMKGKPLISYNAGGIPLQVRDEENSFVVKEVGDTDTVSDHLYTLFSDDALYARMSKAAVEHARQDVLTMANAINWLYLASVLVGEEELSAQKMRSLPSSIELYS